MSAHTLATQPQLVGRYRPGPQPTTDTVSADPSQAGVPSAVAPGMSGTTVHLTGASMRLLEVSLAVAAIATALLAGVGR